jgi:hypothetical protein
MSLLLAVVALGLGLALRFLSREMANDKGAPLAPVVGESTTRPSSPWPNSLVPAVPLPACRTGPYCSQPPAAVVQTQDARATTSVPVFRVGIGALALAPPSADLTTAADLSGGSEDTAAGLKWMERNGTSYSLLLGKRTLGGARAFSSDHRQSPEHAPDAQWERSSPADAE